MQNLNPGELRVEAQVKEIGGDTNTGQRLTFDLLFYVILAVNTNSELYFHDLENALHQLYCT